MHASAFIYVHASAHTYADTRWSMHLRAYKSTHFHAYTCWKHADTNNDGSCYADTFLIHVKSVHCTLTHITKGFRELKAQAVPALLVTSSFLLPALSWLPLFMTNLCMCMCVCMLGIENSHTWHARVYLYVHVHT